LPVASRLVNGCVQGCPLPRAAMPRDGADHHDLRGVCQGNRCGRESAEYIDDLRTADGILKTARESGSVALSLVGVRFAEDSTLEGDGFELSVPGQRAPGQTISGSRICAPCL